MKAKIEVGTVQAAKRKNPFAQIPNSALQNRELSFRARGLLAFILSMPDEFVTRKYALYKFSEKEGRDAVIKAFDELIEQGYIIGVPMIDTKSKRFKGINYIVYEEPLPENPFTENQSPENQGLLNTEEINTEVLKKEKKESLMKEEKEEKKGEDFSFQEDQINPTRNPEAEPDNKSGSLPKDKTYIDAQGYPCVNGERWVMSQEEFNNAPPENKEWLEREKPEQFSLLQKKLGAPESLFKKPKTKAKRY